MVVACLALLVALGDASWATVSQLAPRNSVGPLQLRANAVTSPKIRNGTVGLQDLTPAARRPGPQGPPGPAGPAGPAGAVTRLFAVMNASGSIARSQGTTSAGRLGAGNYEVVFNQNVSACAFVATIGDPAAITGPSGTTAVALRTGNANAVRVDTRSITGSLSDRPFHLVVVC
jgi:hypothetical protein